MSSLSVVGKSVKRLDVDEKVTGQAQYAIDVALPGMLHGKILHSPIPHGRILKIDTSRALALPGVKAVLTATDQDLPKGRWGAWMFDYPILPYDKVRFVGEPIAVVAATEENIALEALNLIDVEYEELPAIFDPEEALDSNATLIHEDLLSYDTIPSFPVIRYGNVATEVRINYGNIDEGFSQADYIFEDVYDTHRQHQGYLEPHTSVVKMDAAGNFKIWTSTQSVHEVRRELSETLNIPVTKLQVITPYVGGGFGGKLDIRVEQFCLLLAKKTGRPIRMSLSYEEELATGHPRHPFKVRIKTGVKKDGTMVAREVDMIMDSGAYAHQGCGVCTYSSNTGARGPYKIPHVKVRNRLVYTNQVPSGGFRGFGNPQTSFAGESQINKICKELNWDPVEFRLKNSVEIGDRMVSGAIISSCENKQCLSKASDAMKWSEPYEKVPGKNKVRGRGIACMHHTSGVFASGALVEVNEDGGLNLLAGCSEIGAGQKTVMAQIAAEAFGINADDVFVTLSDTGVVPYNWATDESRCTFNTGNSVRMAALDARERLLQIAGKMFGLDADNLVMENKIIFPKGKPEQAKPVSDVVMHGLFVEGGPILGKGWYFYSDPPQDPRVTYEGFSFAPFPTFIFAAQAAEVEVDTETGEVTLVKFTSAHDVGRAIHPKNCEGQVEGALATGLGYATSEEVVVDSNGVVVNPQLLDYKLPCSLDMPRVVVPIIVEADDPKGPYGAKGVGEPALVPTAPAIAAAIYDAIGVQIQDLPITAEKVFKALKAKERNL